MSDRSSIDTKARIIAAARTSLRTDGIMGASARAIARHGDFNQALNFYHFGSLNDLFIAVLDELSIERTDRYGDRLSGVRSLADIIEITGELHLEELQDGHIAILAQLLASVATEPDLRAPLREQFRPWADTVETALVEAMLSMMPTPPVRD